MWANSTRRLVKATGQPLRRLALGLVAVALVAAPALARPDPFRTLALRFFAPWLDLDRIGWFAIEVKPGDAVAAIGSDFAVEATVSPRFGSNRSARSRHARMDRRQRGDAPDSDDGQSRPLPPPAGRSRRPCPAWPATSIYRVSTDSARSRAYRVTAVEPPEACEFSARVEPPAYTKLPASDAKDPSKIEAIEGSRVVLTFYACMPFRDFELTWPTPRPASRSRSWAMPIQT